MKIFTTIMNVATICRIRQINAEITDGVFVMSFGQTSSMAITRKYPKGITHNKFQDELLFSSSRINASRRVTLILI